MEFKYIKSRKLRQNKKDYIHNYRMCMNLFIVQQSIVHLNSLLTKSTVQLKDGNNIY